MVGFCEHGNEPSRNFLIIWLRGLKICDFDTTVGHNITRTALTVKAGTFLLWLR